MIKIEILAGTEIIKAIDEAIKVAKGTEELTCFSFNGILMRVFPQSYREDLRRIYELELKLKGKKYENKAN